jgi:hypothetical protein
MMGNHPSLCCFVQVSTNRFSVKEVSEALEPCLESGLADETDAGGLCSGVASEGVVDTAPLAAVPVPAHISGSLRPAAQQPSPAADSECESERVLNRRLPTVPSVHSSKTAAWRAGSAKTDPQASVRAMGGM